MSINITGRHMEITDALRNYATEKLTHLHHHHHQILSMHIVLGVEKLLNIAEATLHVPHGAQIHAESQSDDMYSAIDFLSEKLKRQLVRLKEKQSDHR